jgi:lysyl-tRNA synthetase class I
VHCDHEYLNFKGTKLSKSRGAAVDVPYFLSKYDPDALRYYLTATAPETRDTEPALRVPKGHPGRISWSGTTTSWWRRGAAARG